MLAEIGLPLPHPAPGFTQFGLPSTAPVGAALPARLEPANSQNALWKNPQRRLQLGDGILPRPVSPTTKHNPRIIYLRFSMQ